MKRIRDRVAGLDVHRDTVVACCRVVGPDGEVGVTKQSFPTTQKGLGELAVFLSEAAITTVAMESTGVYWRAPYYALEGMFPELWLCNAQHVKNVPGRKSDLSNRNGWLMSQPTGWCAPPSSPRPRSESSASSPGTGRPKSTPGEGRSSDWRRSSRTPG